MQQEQLLNQLNATKARAFDLVQELDVVRNNYATLERTLVKIAGIVDVNLSESGSLDTLVSTIESLSESKPKSKKGD